MRLFGTCDPQVLFDLRRLCNGDVETKAGRDEGAGPGNPNLQDVTTRERLQSTTSLRSQTGSESTLAHATAGVKFAWVTQFEI